MPSRLTVVLSQGQSQNPAKRGLEEDLATALLMEPGIDLSIVPHLYDLTDDHTGMLFLRSVKGDMVVLSWMFARAAHWELDRAGVKGHEGAVLLKPPSDDEDDEPDENGNGHTADGKAAAIGPLNVPNRKIYCLDLRDFDSPQPYLDEIRRIAAETQVETVSIQVGGLIASTRAAGAGLVAPTPLGNPTVQPLGASQLTQWVQGQPAPGQLARYLDPADRRWHPVIDYSRCTNCMECIDFCLFGVYGVDVAERLVVEQPDNCRKGCPACSRVCPEHAIIFPMHKSPEIAGAPGDAVGGLKIDLSKLFGGGDALDIAVLERDAELVKDGRDAVGMSAGIPKRQVSKPAGPKDDLDKLMDELDSLSL
jgi:hypothetical protein